MSLGNKTGRFHAPCNALSIIGDSQTKPVRVLCQTRGDLRGVCVLDGIVESLLRDPENSQRNFIV
jgi:hypothetical protein